MTNVYIVKEIDYAYNDEYYYTTENRGGNSVVAFKKLEDAKKLRNAATKKRLQDLQPAEIVQYISDHNSEYEDFYRCILAFFPRIAEIVSESSQKLSLDELVDLLEDNETDEFRQIASNFISFYLIEEVPIYD